MNAETHLSHLLSRRSVRNFSDQPIDKSLLERLIVAATTAPSPTNRQPWRYSVVTDIKIKQTLVEALKIRVKEMKEIIHRGHHSEDFGNYSDFFHEPLERAQAIIIPQYREYPDLIANFIQSGGGDVDKFNTAKSMQSELCATSASVMNLLLQAHAEGLASCWMSGPMIARDLISELLKIKSPWKMIGAVALGYPVDTESPKPRKPLTDIIQWF